MQEVGRMDEDIFLNAGTSTIARDLADIVDHTSEDHIIYSDDNVRSYVCIVIKKSIQRHSDLKSTNYKRIIEAS